MSRSSSVRLIASLSDVNLSESIEWITPSIKDAAEYLVPGLWVGLPQTDGVVLLSDEASISIHEDTPPWHIDDDLHERVVDNYPTHIISIGPRGGVRTDRTS